MQLDHIAYLVRDTDSALSALAPFSPEIEIDRRPLDSQKAFITLLSTANSAQKIELVEPFSDNFAMQGRLDREGADSVLYHVGYNVEDFDASFRNMRGNGWLPLTMPFEGFNPGCRASHLYNPQFGMVEIAEVTPR
jgi:hypothetical protein